MPIHTYRDHSYESVRLPATSGVPWKRKSRFEHRITLPDGLVIAGPFSQHFIPPHDIFALWVEHRLRLHDECVDGWKYEPKCTCWGANDPRFGHWAKGPDGEVVSIPFPSVALIPVDVFARWIAWKRVNPRLFKRKHISTGFLDDLDAFAERHGATTDHLDQLAVLFTLSSEG